MYPLFSALQVASTKETHTVLNRRRKAPYWSERETESPMAWNRKAFSGKENKRTTSALFLKTEGSRGRYLQGKSRPGRWILHYEHVPPIHQQYHFLSAVWVAFESTLTGSLCSRVGQWPRFSWCVSHNWDPRLNDSLFMYWCGEWLLFRPILWPHQ